MYGEKNEQIRGIQHVYGQTSKSALWVLWGICACRNCVFTVFKLKRKAKVDATFAFFY